MEDKSGIKMLLLSAMTCVSIGMISFVRAESGAQVKYMNLIPGQDVKFNAQFQSGPCKNEDIYVGKDNKAGVYRFHEGCDVAVVKGYIKNSYGQWLEVAQYGPIFRTGGMHAIGLTNKGRDFFEIVTVPVY
jgi:hypothetical protein